MVDQIRNFINGEYVDGVGTFDDINPVDGSLAAQVHTADKGVVDRAVKAARDALNGPWGSMSTPERVAILRRIADRIEERFDDLLAAEIRDTGKPVELAKTLDVYRASANFRSFTDTAASAGLDAFITEPANGSNALMYAVRKPLGVVGVIVPWNLPLLLLTWKVAPALATGNTVVVKPSEETPASAALLGEIMAEAGLPDGVYNVVHGYGDTGALITTHPDVDGVTFTGESKTGSAIQKAVSDRVLPVSFELGGKNAALVFEDANIEETVAGLTHSLFTNSGQVCLCTERVYIQRPVFDEVVAGLKESAQKLKIGTPYEEGTQFGPLISAKHREKVHGYARLAKEHGAETIIGGEIPDMPEELAGGSWYTPTLWTGLEHTDQVMREEVFGPVAGLIPFDTEEEAVRMANDTEYGLASAIWTTNLERAHRVAPKMNVGLSWVNTWYLRDLRAPFGGSGLSGIGREGGVHSFDFYTEPVNVAIKLA
ncbi:2-hydroxymuconic semialdehyde dehydrogenase [Rothia aerolata]|uniref:Aldehyde dehydrogenase n=1 Tax=Rothia aerolata TaxID=1812262 RepID=A0A917IR06_9MICC|nr:2-hydroxymuconic semialdehyde dehydrogenase [Rothia aerolata]GGH61271.1 aldehyde dehydrogenase [Rothia aerolata]